MPIRHRPGVGSSLPGPPPAARTPGRVRYPRHVTSTPPAHGSSNSTDGTGGTGGTDRAGGPAAREGAPADCVRVVTVAYNPGGELERFLESVGHATRRQVHLVIADNGSDHELVHELAERFGARVVGGRDNLGYGGGANLGAADLNEDWVVVANPDIVWEPGSLDVLIDTAVDHPRAGCLGPRIVNPDGTVYPSGRALPTLGRGAGHALLTRVWPSNPFSAAYHSQNGIDQVREVGWLSGACLLLPAQMWRQLGGFDDAYFMFFEDVDLGARVARAGRTNLQVPAAVVVHEQGASWKARPERMIRAHHASARRYLAGVYAAPWQAPLRWGISAGLRVREEIEVRSSRRLARSHGPGHDPAPA